MSPIVLTGIVTAALVIAILVAFLIHRPNLESGGAQATVAEQTTMPRPRRRNKNSVDSLQRSSNYVNLSVTHPTKCEKDISSQFMLNLYISGTEAEEAVARSLSKGFVNQKPKSHKLESVDIPPEVKLKVSLSCRTIEFSEPQTKYFSKKVETLIFVGTPRAPGSQTVLVSIEHMSRRSRGEPITRVFKVNVVDYIVDHISRRKFTQVVTVITTTAAVLLWTLTFLEQIDKTWGTSAGTAATLFSGFLLNHYQGFRSTVTSHLP